MSDWDVILLRPARRYLERLTRQEQERILDALETLRKNPRQASVKPLKGRPEWRISVGGRRVLFRIDEKSRLFVVTLIGPRGDVYKK